MLIAGGSNYGKDPDKGFPGYTGGEVLAASELYNIKTETWELTGDLTQPRDGVKIVVTGGLNQDILLMSGTVEGSSVEIFNPVNMKWTVADIQLKKGREYAGIAEVPSTFFKTVRHKVKNIYEPPLINLVMV